ncbi:MAG: hypothetical protein ACRD2E_12940 [Terriglobales bacterium]
MTTRSNRRDFVKLMTATGLVPAVAGSVAAVQGENRSADDPAPRGETAGVAKQRVIVLTDIGADPDDTESTCRLLPGQKIRRASI